MKWHSYIATAQLRLWKKTIEPMFDVFVDFTIFRDTVSLLLASSMHNKILNYKSTDSLITAAAY